MQWDWLGTEDSPQGIATYCSRGSKIALALPSFEKANALAQLIDELRAEAWDEGRMRLRAAFNLMCDET